MKYLLGLVGATAHAGDSTNSFTSGCSGQPAPAFAPTRSRWKPATIARKPVNKGEGSGSKSSKAIGSHGLNIINLSNASRLSRVGLLARTTCASCSLGINVGAEWSIAIRTSA